MRRSVENAEHVGLFVPWRDGNPPRFPNPFTGPPRRRCAGRLDFAEPRRNGIYLPPARALAIEDAPVPAPRRRAPVLVDVRSPYDPFAGRAA